MNITAAREEQNTNGTKSRSFEQRMRIHVSLDLTHDIIKFFPGNGRCEAIIITWIMLVALLKAANDGPKLCILPVRLINRLHVDLASCHDNYLPQGLPDLSAISWATCASR